MGDNWDIVAIGIIGLIAYSTVKKDISDIVGSQDFVETGNLINDTFHTHSEPGSTGFFWTVVAPLPTLAWEVIN